MAYLKDVAEELGLSVSLVSKVINNRLGTSGVSKETAEIILDTAKRMGYHKNRTAAGLRSRRHNSIGILIHHFGNFSTNLAERLLMSIANKTEEYGCQISLNFIFSATDFVTKLSRYNSGNVDGIIIGGIPHAEALSAVRAKVLDGIPIVSIYDDPLPVKVPNVGICGAEVGRIMFDYLHKLGCRRTLVIGPSGSSRLVGLLQAIETAGISYPKKLFVKTRDYGFKEGRRAVQEALAGNVKFDSVAAISDEIGFAVIQELRKNGISVPGQVKVIGVDNSPACEFCDPPLTSVSLMPAERGDKAVELLMSGIGGKKVRSVNMAPEIIERLSSRQPVG